MTEPTCNPESSFALDIMHKRYSWDTPSGKETWAQIARRVGENVMGAVNAPRELVQAVVDTIRRKEFIPGGRYLYAAGRPFHQVNNCFSGDTRFLTDRGVRTLAEATGEKVKVRNRFGEWEEAEVHCFGEQELLDVTFNNGFTAACTAEHLWWQEDGTRVPTSEVERVPFSVAANFEAPDPEGIRHGIVFGDGHLMHDRYSQIVFVNANKAEHLLHWFPKEVKEVTVGGGAKLHYKELPTEYSPSYARGFIAGLIATDGNVNPTGSVTISCEGLARAKTIAEVAVAAGCVVNSVRVVNRVNPFTGGPRELSVVSIKPFSAPLIRADQAQVFKGRLFRRTSMGTEVESVEATGRTEMVYCVVAPQSQSFTLANGLITSNCLLLRASDSREGWGTHLQNATMALMTGAGIGGVYSDLREEGAPIRRTGGFSSGPQALMQMVNEVGRGALQGGSRRAAIWAGLHWNHPDIMKFIRQKEWREDVRKIKESDFNFPATMDFTNISVILDTAFFEAYQNLSHPKHSLAQQVYWTSLEHMLRTAEPGFSVDAGANEGENLRNACTELVSRDTDDVCNLGSLNLARISTPEQMRRVTELAIVFLLAGTVYSDLPYEAVRGVREKNRRLGLGLMGLHEWLLLRGKRYGPDLDLSRMLAEYERSGEYANTWADRWNLSRPVKTRAVAPVGTIGIVAETTTGVEPIFCAAYWRRYYDLGVWQEEPVLDPTAVRLVSSGVDPDKIEDAYSLAEDPGRRLGFQALVQRSVDHAISSTVNLPAWGGKLNNPDTVQAFGIELMRHLPNLRGVTAYPDGARGGQPLTPMPFREAQALLRKGVTVVEEAADVCGITRGESCGA